MSKRIKGVGRGSTTRSVSGSSRGLREKDGLDAGDVALQIGQTLVHCDPAGRVQSFQIGSQRRRRRQRKEKTSADTSEADEAALDYIDNIARGSDDEGEGQLQDKFFFSHHMASWNLDYTQDVLPDGDTSSGEADSEESTSEYDSDVSVDDVLAAFQSKLSLAERYPVTLRSRAGAGGPGSSASGSMATSGLWRSTPRKGVAGRSRMSAGGTSVPHDSASLKRQKRKARRAARVQCRGLDIGAVHQQLHDFVVARGDLMAIPVVGVYGSSLVVKMAALFGLKCTIQGSGKRKSAMVSSTSRTALPEGDNQARLVSLMQRHKDALAAFGPSIRGSKKRSPPSRKPRPPIPSGADRAATRFQAPIAFVACGTLDPNMIPYTVETPTVPLQGTGRSLVGDPSPSHLDSPSGHCGLGASPMLGSWSLGSGLFGTEGLLQGDLCCSDGTPLGTADRRPPGLGWGAWSSFASSEGLGRGSFLGEMDHMGSHVDHMGSHMEGMIVEDTGSPYGASGSASMGGFLRTTSESIDADVESGREAGSLHAALPQFSTAAKEKAARKKKEKLARRAARAAVKPGRGAPMGVTRGPAVGTSLEFGDFERHTTGFGSRMLAKWGFEGQGSGLGRDGQGRAEPLKVTMRQKSLGLGA
eukprot:jgi/Botrbrau1/4731/Bobra.0137s0003.1